MTRHSQRNQRIIALRLTGLSMKEISIRLGLTKNTVVGVCQRYGGPDVRAVTLTSKSRGAFDHTSHNPVRTMEQRLQALHDRMDRLLLEARELRHLHYEKPHAVTAPNAWMA